MGRLSLEGLATANSEAQLPLKQSNEMRTSLLSAQKLSPG